VRCGSSALDLGVRSRPERRPSARLHLRAL